LRQDRCTAADPDNVITQSPLRLRWGDWRKRQPLLVHVGSAAGYEEFRQEAKAQGQDPAGQVPAGFELEDAAAQTAMALLRHRDNEPRLLEVGYAACLMETLLNTPCAILRTDLIRRVYQEAQEVSAGLGISWRGRGGCFMLPLNEDARQPHAFAQRVEPIADLKELFATLRDIAGQRYQSLKKGYVIYYPRHLAL